MESEENNEEEVEESKGEVEEANESEEEETPEAEEEDDREEWDEYCNVCQDGGNVMCCENCPQVAHYGCIGLKRAPLGDWWCKDCSVKKAAVAQKKAPSTRLNKDVKMNSGRTSAATTTRQAALPTRQSRRHGR